MLHTMVYNKKCHKVLGMETNIMNSTPGGYSVMAEGRHEGLLLLLCSLGRAAAGVI